MVDATIGHGSDFMRGDGGSPEGFDTVGEITDLGPPELSRDVVEKTHMKSPERWREFIGGMKDAGECTLEYNFDPSDPTVVAFHGDLNSDEPKNYRIVFPDSTAWEFKAFLIGLGSGVPTEDKMVGSATFKLTGKPNFIA